MIEPRRRHEGHIYTFNGGGMRVTSILSTLRQSASASPSGPRHERYVKYIDVTPFSELDGSCPKMLPEFCQALRHLHS